MSESFTHINKNNQPSMVDVSAKSTSLRVARAKSTLIMSAEIIDLLEKGDSVNKKGPVFQTAVVAGIMASKKTSELIPLCHSIPIDGCEILIRLNEAGEVEIFCTVKTTHKTGVEMEALTGASIAALTIYDMCKSLSHDIRIVETRLLEKTGGKSDFKKA